MVNIILLISMALICALPVGALAVEPYISVGLNSHSVKLDTDNQNTDTESLDDEGYHFSVGIRNLYGKSQRHILGFGIDIDEIASSTLIGYRALDYAYQITDRIRVGGFFGAASLDSGLPQNGYYAGLSVSVLKIIWTLDFTMELRRGDGLARDRRASDPEGERGDIFLDYNSPSAALTWRF